MFSIPPIILQLHTLAIATWNARALLHQKPGPAKAKLKYLDKLLEQFDILLLQEVHSNADAIFNLIQRYRHTHTAHFSPHPNPQAGGLITFISNRTSLNSRVDPVVIIAPGRITKTTIHNETDTLHIYNIHNYDISHPQFTTLRRSVDADKSNTNVAYRRHVTCLGGDFNFHAPGEAAILIGTDAGLHELPVQPNQKTDAKKWAPILQGLTELAQHDYTRIGAHGTCPASLSRLDRIYISLPPSALMQLTLTSGIVSPATNMNARELSDHATAYACLTQRCPMPRHLRPIPSWLAKSKTYAKCLANLQQHAKLDLLLPIERWQAHKSIIRQASNIALKALTSKPADTPELKLQALSTAARTIWRDEARMVKRTLTALPELQDNLHVDSHGHVALRDPAAYQRLFQLAMTTHLEERGKQISESNRTRKHKSSQCIQNTRWKTLWSQIDPRMQLAGIILPNGSITHQPTDMLHALAQYWGPVFQPKEIDIAAAKAFLAQYAVNFVRPQLSLPPLPATTTMAFYNAPAILQLAPTGSPTPAGVPLEMLDLTFFSS